jgi:DNA repair protein RecN (Recombination protein N)
MLRELRIRNFAVIEEVTVPFAPGLNVLSGETGAGKSIVVDALLLLAGTRAQTDVIRTDADVATVEGVFAIAPGSAATRVLDEAGLRPEEGELVVRRELARSGRHRAFLNDSPVTVGLLERLGEHLVEVHGQHEHQRLLEPARQLELLDRFADAEALVSRVAALHEKHRAAREALERTRAAERDRAQREDLLRFQVSELEAARLVPGEESALRDERRRVQHAERLRAGLVEAAALLDDGREAAIARLGRSARLLSDLGRLDAAFGEPAAALGTAALHADEALRAIRALRDTIEAEPDRLEAIDERLDALARLKRKYGDSEEAMLAFREAAAAELARLARYEEICAEQERLRTDLGAELAEAAAALSDRRRHAAAELATRAQREIRRLGMERAEFRVFLDAGGADTVSARGWDRVEFQLSTNPGEARRALARVASGGELSRTMLALHAVLAEADGVPTMVFDEVDAGIGGRIAGVVGDTLVIAARRRQVLCVTHLAPIAARAAHLVRIAKMVHGSRTRATASVLEGQERVPEIARMLGGESPTALRHARELLAAGIMRKR